MPTAVSPNWWDSDPLFSKVGNTRNYVAPFLKHQFSKGRYFSANRMHKVWGVNLLVVMDQ